MMCDFAGLIHPSANEFVNDEDYSVYVNESQKVNVSIPKKPLCYSAIEVLPRYEHVPQGDVESLVSPS